MGFLIYYAAMKPIISTLLFSLVLSLFPIISHAADRAEALPVREEQTFDGFNDLLKKLGRDDVQDRRLQPSVEEIRVGAINLMNDTLHRYFNDPQAEDTFENYEEFTTLLIDKWGRIFTHLKADDETHDRVTRIGDPIREIRKSLSLGIIPLPTVSHKTKGGGLFALTGLLKYFPLGIAPVSIKLSTNFELASIPAHPLQGKNFTDSVFNFAFHDLLHISLQLAPSYRALDMGVQSGRDRFFACVEAIISPDQATSPVVNRYKRIMLFYVIHDVGLDSFFNKAINETANNENPSLVDFALEMFFSGKEFPIQGLFGVSPDERMAIAKSIKYYNLRDRKACLEGSLETFFQESGTLRTALREETSFFDMDSHKRIDLRRMLYKFGLACQDLEPSVESDDNFDALRARFESLHARDFQNKFGRELELMRSVLIEINKQFEENAQCKEVKSLFPGPTSPLFDQE